MTRDYYSMDDQIPNLSNITPAQISVSIGTGLAAIYAIARKLKFDRSSDTKDEKTLLILENLNTQLESERQENTELRLFIEKIAVERNQAVQTIGSLKGHITGLEQQVELLKEHVKMLESENRKMMLEVRLMRKENQDAKKEIQDLMKQIITKK